MDFNELWKIISTEFVPLLEKSTALTLFARNRAKFEGWMKVELCGVLVESAEHVLPEGDGRVDIVTDEWAIELKTVNTNYRCEGAVNKHRPITRNVSGVIADIWKLKQQDRYPQKAVAFIVFPVPRGTTGWETHLKRISSELARLEEAEFFFKNGLRGLLYLGLVDGP